MKTRESIEVLQKETAAIINEYGALYLPLSYKDSDFAFETDIDPNCRVGALLTRLGLTCDTLPRQGRFGRWIYYAP